MKWGRILFLPAAVLVGRRNSPRRRRGGQFGWQRLEPELIWDSMSSAAGKLDLSVGGRSFDVGAGNGGVNRRAAYLIRGFSTSRDVLPNVFKAFDVDDGRVPCPVRTQTV